MGLNGVLVTNPPPPSRRPERGITLYGNAGSRIRAKVLRGDTATNGGGIHCHSFSDSLFKTVADTGDQWVNNMCNYLRGYLQERFSPYASTYSKTGGAGFIPFIDDGTTRGISIWGGDNGTFDNITGTGGTDVLQKRYSGDAGYDGMSGKVYELISGANKGFWHYIYRENPTSDFRYGFRDRNQRFSSATLIYEKQSSGGILQYDSGDFVSPAAHTKPYTIGAGVTTYELDTAGTAGCGFMGPTSMNSNAFWQQYINKGTGTIRLEGLIHCAGDENCSMHVFDWGRGGAVVSDYQSAYRLAGIARFLTGSRRTSTVSNAQAYTGGDLFQNAGVRIYQFGTNECGTSGSPTVSAATYGANLLALCQSHESNPDAGDGIIVFAEPRDNANALGRWASYEAQARDVAKTMGYAFVNLWEMGDYDAATGYMTTNSYFNTGTDSTHRLHAWHKYVAKAIYRTIMYMVEGGR